MFGTVVPLVIIIATALILHIVLHILDKFVYKNQFFKGEFVGRLAFNIDHALWFSFLVILTPLLILNYQSERLGDYKFEHDYFYWWRFIGWVPMTILCLVVILTVIQYFKPSIGLSTPLWTRLRNIVFGVGQKFEKSGLFRFLRSLIKQFKALLFVLIVAIGCFGSLLFFPIPFHTIELQNPTANDMLMDFHCHTTASDGLLTPEEKVRMYMSMGLHGAAFTDHWNIDGGVIAQQYVQENHLDFTVILGQEYSGPGLHLNFFGLNESIVGLGSTSPTSGTYRNLNVTDMITYVKANGGYVMVNHYDHGQWTYQQLADWGVDGFEIISSGRLYPEELRQFCIDKGLICTAASDDHLNQPFMTFTKVTLLDPNNRTVASIFESMKAIPPQTVTLLQDDFLETFVQYTKNCQPGQILAWYGWSLIFFASAWVVLRNANNRITEPKE
jgi:hypothetical protein